MKIDLKILDSRVSEDQLKPSTPGSAGIDLRAMIDIDMLIYPGETFLIGTGIAIHIEDCGYAGFILPRSGLGNRGLVLGNLVGLIDADYQGEIKVSLWNRGNDPIKIKPLDRIAQLVISPISVPHFNIVTEFEQSSRGECGFGSTGL